MARQTDMFRRLLSLGRRFLGAIFVLVVLVVIGRLHPEWLWYPVAILGIATLVAALAVLVTIVPGRLVRNDIRDVHGRRRLTPADQLKAKSDARTSLLQSISALGLVIGLVFTILQVTSTQRSTQRQLQLTQQQLQLTEEQQLDERFSRAVQSLGDNDLSIRLGGVYTLGRIGENDRYRERVLGVLGLYATANVHDVSSGSANLRQGQPDVFAALKAGCMLGGGPPFSDLLDLPGRPHRRATH